MKRVKLLLRTVCVFVLIFCTIPISAGSVSAPAVSGTAGNSSDKMEYYPFVHSEEEGFAWVEELIGDCSSCLPGYLYVQKLSTGERWQVLDRPVDLFRSSGETLYCIVDGSTILQTDYWGEPPTTLYQASYGDIDDLEILEGKLYFPDGDHVICLDLLDLDPEELATCDGITSLLPLSADAFVWWDVDNETYLHNNDTGIDEPASMEELFAGDAFVSVTPLDHSDAVSAASSDEVKFPLPEYPTGSYFTKDGAACASHGNCSYGGCNCTCYRGAIQCAGFAMYAFDRYSHQYPSKANWYSATPSDPHYTRRGDELITDEDVRLKLCSLGYGAYARLGRSEKERDIHSIVTAGCDSSSITLYEGNHDGHCRVRLVTYTFAQYRKAFPFIENTVAHSFTGSEIRYSADYHKRLCSYDGCSGYILQGHYAETAGTNVKCLGCGYIGNIPVGIMSDGGVDS